jgi:16S rRNA (adenine1518-N6/adenine1519-N6)-dimethyltransferase
MKFDLDACLAKLEVKTRKYKIVANLPYNITSIFLRTFLSAKLKPESLTLMLQKEVAHRITTQAPDNNLLALSVAYYGQAKIIREVKAGNFWPEPEVDSSVIKIVLDDIKHDVRIDRKFFRLAKMAFSSKRKMLRNNLSAGFKIKPVEIEAAMLKEGIDPKRRAEDLSLEDFKKLFAAMLPFMV